MQHSKTIVLVLFCGLSTTALSQQPQSKAANADVLATVQNDVAITTTGQTNFGTFGNSAHTETINPAAPTGNQSTAMFALSNPSGGQVAFQCPSTTTLTAPTSSIGMAFTPVFAFNLSSADQASSQPTPLCGIGTSGFTQVWLWLGGSLAVGAGQAAGSYSGVFTLTVLHL